MPSLAALRFPSPETLVLLYNQFSLAVPLLEYDFEIKKKNQFALMVSVFQSPVSSMWFAAMPVRQSPGLCALLWARHSTYMASLYP